MKSSRRRPLRRRGGFTLIEVMLVLLILVILGALAVTMYSQVQRRANIRAAQSQIGLFKTPLELYYQEFNVYPSTEQGLEALIVPPSNLPNPEKWIQYLDADQIPLDPWGQQYMYASPGSRNPDKYDIWSLGPDLADGTSDDIGNW